MGKPSLRGIWVESGTRNHMLADASWVIGRLVNAEGADLFLENKGQVKSAPKTVTIRGASFKWEGRIGSKDGGRKTQFIRAPAEIAPNVKSSIGEDISGSLSNTGCNGWLFAGAQSADKDRRRE